LVSTSRWAPVTVLAAAATAAAAWHAAGARLDPRAVAVVAASMAAALMVALTLVSYLSWRLAADRRSLYVAAACCCYAAGPLLFGVVVPSLASSDLSGEGVAFQIAGAPAVIAFGLAARRAGGRGRRRASSVLAPLVLATGAIAAVLLALPDALVIDLEPGASAALGARIRAMAMRGVVAVYLCYEHDPVTLVARLLSCELREAALAAGRLIDLTLEELQGRLRDVASGALTLREVLDSDPLLGLAEERMAAYADRLVLFQGSGSRTDVPAISDAVSRFAGERCVVFVDYVQKVPVHPAASSESERVGRVIESLKELALDERLPVVAISAADQRGLTARRLHLHHFRGSASLAYEADAVVVLNDKLDVVSKAHIAYSPTRIDEFRRQVVFSIEKNRNGMSDIDLEFVKEFGSYRFDPQGAWVAERLWHENSVEM
jgi:replicative DNA helicase